MPSNTQDANKDSVLKDGRRQQLIDATILCISRYGLSNLTVAKVTQQAKMSAGIVNFYFNGKTELLLETLRWLADEYIRFLDVALVGKQEAAEVLATLVEASFDEAIFRPENVAVWYGFYGESGSREEYSKICAEVDKVFESKAIKAVQELMNQSHWVTGDAKPLSLGLQGLIDGFWQQSLFDPNTFNVEQAKQTCHDYLSTLFAEHYVVKNPSSRGLLTALPREKNGADLLPTWTYRDPAFFQLEKQQLLKRSWLLVGHSNDMPNPKDYLTLDAYGERALVLRDKDGEIHAYHNMCRHRGARLLGEASGTCRNALVCPFHGWSYNLQGKLVGVPAFETFSNLDKSKNGLVPLELEIWQGFIFIRFLPGESSLAEQMAPVADLLAPYRLTDVQPLSNRYEQVRPYNWKVVHDIDNEGYHVPVGHPALNQLYGADYEDNTVGDIPVSRGYISEVPARLWSVRNYQEILPHFEHLPKENQRLWMYIGLFPNTVLALYPDSVEFYMTMGIDEDSTVFRGACYGLKDDRREVKLARYLNIRINSETDAEDKQYVDSLQQGISSDVFPQEHLSSIESGVQDFHRRVREKLPVSELKSPPAANKMEAINEQLRESISQA